MSAARCYLFNQLDITSPAISPRQRASPSLLLLLPVFLFCWLWCRLCLCPKRRRAPLQIVLKCWLRRKGQRTDRLPPELVSPQLIPPDALGRVLGQKAVQKVLEFGAGVPGKRR